MAVKFQRGRAVPAQGLNAPMPNGQTKEFRATPQNFHLATKAIFRLIAQPDKAPIEWVRLVKRHGLLFSSDSGSQYVSDGVRLWRYSGHWGRVATCQWDIVPRPVMMTGSAVTEAWSKAMARGPLTGSFAWGPDPIAVIGEVLFSQMNPNV